MIVVNKIYLLLFSFLSAEYVSSSSECNNEDWPKNPSVPFPYPTPGPVDIDPSKARHLHTPTPLQFKVNPFQLSKSINTGSTYVTVSTENVLGIATGGVLYNQTYRFFQCEFFWDLDLKNDAADKVGGVGSPIQAVASFFNLNYKTKEEAAPKRDGIAQIVTFIYVSKLPNLFFYPFEFALLPVKEAESTTYVSEFLAYDWYLLPSLTNDYYAYPGMYHDFESDKTYDSATVMVLNRNPPPTISHDQFNKTFGSFLDFSKKPYSHTAQPVPLGQRPVVHANGLVLSFLFD